MYDPNMSIEAIKSNLTTIRNKLWRTLMPYQVDAIDTAFNIITAFDNESKAKDVLEKIYESR